MPITKRVDISNAAVSAIVKRFTDAKAADPDAVVADEILWDKQVKGFCARRRQSAVVSYSLVRDNHPRFTIGKPSIAEWNPEHRTRQSPLRCWPNGTSATIPRLIVSPIATP